MIIEGFFVDAEQEFYGQVVVENGKIKEIIKDREKFLEPEKKYSKDCVIFPGFIDIHVHAREDLSREWNHKETYETAFDAAKNGGVVAFADMPNTPFLVLDKESHENKAKLTNDLPIALFVGVNKKSRPFCKNAIYKVFMTHSVGELYFDNLDDLDNTLSFYKGCKISFHCEDHKILQSEEGRPAKAEVEAIKDALALIKKYNLTGNICHVSTKEGMKLIENAKKEGVSVTCEVTSHHLFFNNKAENPFLTMNPPLRDEEDRLYLLDCAKRGVVDYFATDHAPHLIEEKENGVKGVPGLDTYGCFVTWLIKQDVPLKTIAKMTSFNAARFLNLNHGLVKVGYDAKFTVLNLNKESIVQKENLKTKCKWSPFEGFVFPGSVEEVIV